MDPSSLRRGTFIFFLMLVAAATIGLVAHMIAAATISDDELSFSEKMKRTSIYNGLMSFIAFVYILSTFLWVQYAGYCNRGV